MSTADRCVFYANTRQPSNSVIVADPTACDDIGDLIVAAEGPRAPCARYAPVCPRTTTPAPRRSAA